MKNLAVFKWNNKSIHCESVKERIAKSLFDRAKKLSHAVTAEKNKLIIYINKDLVNNVYSEKLIKKCIRNMDNIVSNSPNPWIEKPAGFMIMTYVPKLSEKDRRVARKYKIKTIFKSENTIRKHLI